MIATSTIEIRVTGNNGSEPLSPANYDIKDIVMLLQNVEDLLYPGKKSRPNVSYSIESGSVRNIFRTSRQAVVSFVAVLAMVRDNGNLDGLDLATAQAFERIQESSVKSSYSFEFSSSDCSSPILVINPDTNYFRSQLLWIDAEFYLYGQLTNAGGKDKSNIHLDTKEYGTLIISLDKEILRNAERNMLYREFGVRVQGNQNIETGEMDRSNLKLLELIDYSQRYEEAYLQGLIKKVGDKFDGLDVDEWISDIRGGYEA